MHAVAIALWFHHRHHGDVNVSGGRNSLVVKESCTRRTGALGGLAPAQSDTAVLVDSGHGVPLEQVRVTPSFVRTRVMIWPIHAHPQDGRPVGDSSSGTRQKPRKANTQKRLRYYAG